MKTEANIPLAEESVRRAAVERGHAMEILRQDVERFRTMIDMLPTVVFETNTQGRITFANKFGFQFFGVTQQQFREGVNVEDLVVADDVPRLRVNYASVLSGANPGANEYTVTNMMGEPLSVIVYSDAIRDQNDEAVGLRGILVDISIRKKIETTLKESESRYKNLFMTIDDAAFIYDAATGEILDANQAAEHLYGYTHQEYLTMNIAGLTATGGTNSSGGAIDPLPGGYQASPLRYHKKSNGAVFPVESSSGTFEWQTRRCRFDIYRDLAGRRKAELELRKSEARLNLYLNAMHDGLCDWNLSNGEMFYSPGWIDMLGYEADDVPPYAMFWRSNVHRDDEARLQSALDEHLGGRTDQLAAEFRMRTKLQRWIWIGCRGRVIEWNEDGSAHRLIATFTDISERKAAEERLQHVADENRLLMEHASDAILITSDEGRILDLNTKATELFEYTRIEFLALSVHDIVPMEEQKIHPLPFDFLRTGAPLVEERIFRKKGGMLIAVESSLKSLPDGRIHASLRNITERKRAETEFKSIILSEVYEKLFIKLRVFRHGESMAMNLNRLMLFAQNITDLHAVLRKQQAQELPVVQMPATQRVHVAVNEYNLLVYPELRSIGLLLQAIGNENIHMERVSMPHASGSELLKLNENVKQLISQMKDLLTDPEHGRTNDDDVKMLRRDMLRDVDTLKRHVSELMRLVESELACDVGKTVLTVVGKYTPNAFGVAIRLAEPAVKRFAIGKPGEIGEIVSILLHNALQAMEADTLQAQEDKCITVACREGEGRIFIVVEDTGPGVSDAIRDRIFEDGFTTKSDGHGFGLSYARTALKKYGGKISCQPIDPRGARFLIELVVLN